MIAQNEQPAQPLARVVNAHEQLFAIDSSTGKGSYRVNLKHVTCTCPDFTCRRADQPSTSPARCCKHLRTVKVQAPFLIASLKAKQLSDAQLIVSIRHYQEKERHDIAGACRVERHTRQQRAKLDAELREVFA